MKPKHVSYPVFHSYNRIPETGKITKKRTLFWLMILEAGNPSARHW
jgi:hypothetical protein